MSEVEEIALKILNFEPDEDESEEDQVTTPRRRRQVIRDDDGGFSRSFIDDFRHTQKENDTLSEKTVSHFDLFFNGL